MTLIDTLTKLYNDSKFDVIVLESKKFSQNQIDLGSKVIVAKAYRKLGKYLEALDLLESIKLLSNDSIIDKINFHSTMLDILTHMGKYDEGTKQIQQLTPLLEQIDLSTSSITEKQVVAQTYNELARIHFFLSNFDRALEYLKQELNIAHELEDDEKIISSLQNIGSTYTSIGEYILAVDHLEEALERAYKLKSTHLIGHIEDNLGLVLFYQGQLEEALFRIKKSLEIHKQIKDPRGMGFNYEYIGSINLKLNNILEALVNFEQSYVIRKDLGNDTHTASIIFAIITAFLEIGERDNAASYLKELELISIRTKTKRIEMQYRLANAIYLKDSKIFRNIVKAEQILKMVVDAPEITDFSYTVIAYLHLIDILYDQISQLELGEDDEITEEVGDLFIEIEKYTEAIGDIAAAKNLPDLKVSYYNLKGFITISKFQADDAYSYFDEAEELCRNYNLTNIRFQFKEIDTQEDQDQTLVMNKEAFPYKIQKSLNKIIHSLPRLLIVTSLLKNVELTFTELVDLTKMSPGNLGKHCDKLDEIGYLNKSKKIVGDKFLTTYRLTPEGMNEFNKYTGILIPFLTSAQSV